MKIKDFIEELERIESNYGNLPVNCGAENIYLKVLNGTLNIEIGSD